MITIRPGIGYGRHAIYKPLTYDALQEPDKLPYLETCELPINPQTGRSKTCEHGVKFIWDRK